MSLMPSLPDFIFTEKLGKGSYATVYKAYRKGDTREVVAIKCVQKSSLTKSSVENLITEISILKKVKHENIVELKDFQWDNSHIYLILEYCSGGDLSRFIRSKKRLPESVAHKFLQQLAVALQVLRSQNIAHMDLKPQNILLSNRSNPILKLGDFGLAQYLHSGDEATSFRGSPLYMAPEILLKQHYDARVDLWSVGIIFYECLFGQAPYSSQTFAELAEKIKCTNEIELPYGAQVSDKCRELILGLLRRDPSKRMTFEDFFNHPFVDLKHMPTPETYEKGVNLVQKAVKADSENKIESAIKFYSAALEYLVPHIYREPDKVKRRDMRKKLLEYVSRAEELKKLSKEGNSNCQTPKGATSSTEVYKRSNSGSEMPKDIHNIIPKTLESKNISIEELIASKPKLKKAYFFAEQAEALVGDGCYDDAGSLYQNALEIMVPAVSEESPGPRKELLYAEVNKVMQKAEDLKSFQSILKEEKRISRLNSTDAVHFNKSSENVESTCCMQ
ncbi:hypothetical protein JTE90_016685 [Oedothorax gibbosus]|uniref:Serine/threonine-protein kinase ULK3 n=1 Tax=Oedothorax gibbosus TaxID=931172 RepID=A0AAV6TU87_9ARAC|nr:hypothetical protein JTE90_016685 [Oedothorax gibbosus]